MSVKERTKLTQWSICFINGLFCGLGIGIFIGSAVMFHLAK